MTAYGSVERTTQALAMLKTRIGDHVFGALNGTDAPTEQNRQIRERATSAAIAVLSYAPTAPEDMLTLAATRVATWWSVNPGFIRKSDSGQQLKEYQPTNMDPLRVSGAAALLSEYRERVAV
ncbi:MAG: hypothetical protein OXP09_11930 [Gammaproteobacteria bacterium]|nr:hypothetical protein [Gammaproteobacteria bacterium]MDE0366270.1 hypothetical protein [Gammaproteobacteria bacterium]